MTSLELYNEKNEKYYNLIRNDILELVPQETKKILDVGCGTGVTSFAAKQFFGVNEIIGIELFKPAAEIAKKKLDKVITGDIEDIDLSFPENYFDCIICADVIEHTRNPWGVLKKLHRYLNDNGVLIASIPNIRHIVPILKIIFNRFDYQESGVLDKTHLRFFSLYTIKNLFRTTGYRIIQIRTRRSRSWKFNLMNIFSLGLLRPFSISEYIIAVKKNN